MKRKKSSEVEGMWTRSPLVPPPEFQLKRHANLMPPPPRRVRRFPDSLLVSLRFLFSSYRLFCDQYGVLGRGDAS